MRAAHFDAEAAHEQHVEQLQAQVMHYHDLAMKTVGGDTAGAPRAERPWQSSPVPDAAAAAADAAAAGEPVGMSMG